MELLLNSENIPFELENEKTAYDIISELTNYLAESDPKQFIIDLKINDKEYLYDDKVVLSSIDVGDIKKIEVDTNDILGLSLMSLNQVEDFLKNIDVFISGDKKSDVFSKIEDTINWMNQGVTQIVSLFTTTGSSLIMQKDIFLSKTKELFKYIQNIENADFPLEEIKKKEGNQIIKSLEDAAFAIKLCIDKTMLIPSKEEIFERIVTLISRLDDLIPRLENIPILFQTGEDAEAMSSIQALADILEKSIWLFIVFKESFKLYLDEYTVKEVSFEEFFGTITEHLKELMDAVENNDSVMIGDLLEYEFVPNIEEIKNILEKIKNEAFDKVN